MAQLRREVDEVLRGNGLYDLDIAASVDPHLWDRRRYELAGVNGQIKALKRVLDAAYDDLAEDE